MQECNSETEFSINMTQLQTMIESAVKKAMESFGLTEDISKAQEARLDKIVSDQYALENQVSTLNAICDLMPLYYWVTLMIGVLHGTPYMLTVS